MASVGLAQGPGKQPNEPSKRPAITLADLREFQARGLGRVYTYCPILVTLACLLVCGVALRACCVRARGSLWKGGNAGRAG
eukprot:8127834-Pyramimonas_sp.AAC.1